eukprot:TRINITY_DN158741_c0_g1_i1.p1 TRINITY_DN158741_c0_g1~~TRINITY_DN158741_c0_g1_i1.p1  ORF type:complete len:189 (+),score=25.25 TRINITY_DN158741_c0_g1_i1:60-626(+)
MNDDLISYLITDPKYYSNNKDLFKKNLQKALDNNKVDMACFRDKESPNYEELAEVFIETCKENSIENIILNGNYTLAYELGATGVHLTSTQFDNIKDAKRLDLYTIISCHNYNEIEAAQKQHINAITYSPIYKTPNKSEPKGLGKLKETVRIYEDLDIIALGGITSQEQIKDIAKAGAFGFASIRYFV